MFFVQLFKTGRPATAGLFGLVFPLVGFALYGEVPWNIGVTTAIAFAGLTMSIMVFNDWKDREHDRKKGKCFASEHSAALCSYWVWLSAVTGMFLLWLAMQDIHVAALCAVVWCVGIAYSYVPHWYLVQNVIVAVCASSPALCGAVYYGSVNAECALTFLLFMSLLFMAEVYKDIEDAPIDSGYKATLPVRIGHIPTVCCLIGLTYIPAMLAVLHPNPWVLRVMYVGAPLLVFSQACMLLNPERVGQTRQVMNWIVTALLLVLLMTSGSVRAAL